MKLLALLAFGVATAAAAGSPLERDYAQQIQNMGAASISSPSIQEAAFQTTRRQFIPSTPATGVAGDCPAIGFDQHVNKQGETYTISMIPNAPSNVDTMHFGFVNIHVQIVSRTGQEIGDQQNYAMKRVSPTSSEFIFMLHEYQSVLLRDPTNTIAYSFTYCVDHIDCDTEWFVMEEYVRREGPSYPVVPRGSCPDIDFDYAVERIGSEYIVELQVNNPTSSVKKNLGWVDVHIQAYDQATGRALGTFNSHRMDELPIADIVYTWRLAQEQRALLNANPNAYIEFSFTYNVATPTYVDCDTELFLWSDPTRTTTAAPEEIDFEDFEIVTTTTFSPRRVATPSTNAPVFFEPKRDTTFDDVRRVDPEPISVTTMPTSVNGNGMDEVIMNGNGNGNGHDFDFDFVDSGHSVDSSYNGHGGNGNTYHMGSSYSSSPSYSSGYSSGSSPSYSSGYSSGSGYSSNSSPSYSSGYSTGGGYSSSSPSYSSGYSTGGGYSSSGSGYSGHGDHKHKKHHHKKLHLPKLPKPHFPKFKHGKHGKHDWFSSFSQDSSHGGSHSGY